MPASLTNLMDMKLPVGTNLTVSGLISAVLTLLVCLLIIKIAMKVIRRLLLKTKLDDRIQRYIQSGAKLLLYAITVIFVVDSLGISNSSLVAILSVCSLGITLAAEDILGNVAGGLVILSSHPFSIGDFVEANGTAGTVEEISLNHTKLVTPEGQLVLLPNKELANSKLTNFTAFGRRRIKQVVTASYDAPTDVVKAACMKAVSATPDILEDPAPAVYLTDYGSSSIEYTIYCWARPENYWLSSLALCEQLRMTFQEADVEMTYNHLNVHIVETRSTSID